MPSSSDPLPGSNFPTVPAHLHNRILSDLCHPGSSLISVARNHGVELAVLAMWLTEPETREKMLAIEKGGYAHTRMAASVTLASTVEVLHTIIEDYTQARAHAKFLLEHERLTPAASRHDPLPPSDHWQHPDRSFFPGEAILADTSLKAQRLELRRAEGVRRASLHLYRLSRIIPVDDSKLAVLGRSALRADSDVMCSSTLRADSDVMCSSTLRADSDGSGGTALQSGDTSPVPSKSASDFDALPHLSPASAPHADADSSGVACLHEVQACSDEHAFAPSEASLSCSSPLRRTDRCHGVGGQPVQSDPTYTSSLLSSPPPGRTSSSTPHGNSPHGCPADGAAMPPDQLNSSLSPSAPLPLCPSAPSWSSPHPSRAPPW